MTEDSSQKCVNKTEQSRFRLSYRGLVQFTVLLPLMSLFSCLITAIAFQYEEVNVTFCPVLNYLPSISMVIGASPQRYVWRIGIAIHTAPRFLLSVVTYNIHMEKFSRVPVPSCSWYRRLTSINYWLSLTEVGSLIGLTYISSRENYPIHEKCFITFMVASLCHLLLNTSLYRWAGPNMSQMEEKSYKKKSVICGVMLLFTAGLVYSFYLHRRYCQQLAFTYFAGCEYMIVLLNIMYYLTLADDCPDDLILVSTRGSGRPLVSHNDNDGLTNGHANCKDH